MVQSDRSRDRKRPEAGPRRGGGARPAAPPEGAPGRPAPGAPGASAAAGPPKAPRRKRAKAVRRAPKRRAPAPTTGPDHVAPKPRPQPTRERPARATAHEPELRITKPPIWQVAWRWLREDPDRPGPKSERERAVRKVEAESEARRKAFVRDQLQRARLGIVAGAVVADEAAAAATPPKPAKPKATRPHRLWTRSEDAPPGRLAALVHRLLGERTRTDADGDRVIVPPPETDWRWNLHRFFRSNQRAVVYARSMLVVLLLVSTIWFSVLQTTGFDLMDHMEPLDPEDQRSRFRTPVFVIESGSMMHRDAPFGRIGTVDPGDIVVVEKVGPGDRIETFYGDGSRHVAGAKGDVIMFLPYEEGEQAADPIIHRAMAYIHREEISIPNPDQRPNAPPTILAIRFTVEEFGIFEARAVNIPELGLRNYKPIMSGYITRGDNDRSNNWADQALGVTPYPVPEDRIIGRMKAEVPFVGLAKIALSGQEQSLISADDAWCSFLAGQAACDTWLVFFAIVIVFVAVPLLITVVVFGRRAYVRYLDRLAIRRAQDAELARLEAERAAHAAGADAAGALRPHDAADLLSGDVVVEGVPRRRGPTPWADITRPGTTRWQDEPGAP